MQPAVDVVAVDQDAAVAAAAVVGAVVAVVVAVAGAAGTVAGVGWKMEADHSTSTPAIRIRIRKCLVNGDWNHARLVSKSIQFENLTSLLQGTQ